ncbi:ankyrin repeat domain-containing protein [Legionella israelensis]|uniref:ankyrin repeat domain-containing protein n=1 Tax=Legionella israelensis TaxID=454 RepID=UPI00163DA0EC|nr:ankyrin repeat domain-containing protein [Legionella israelensis]
MSVEKFERFSQLPRELQRKIFLEAGLLKKPIHEITLLETRYSDVLDSIFWKHYCYNLFPGIRIHALPSKDSNEEQEKQFWKKLIQNIGETSLRSIKNTTLKKLFTAIFRNDIAKVEELLNTQIKNIDLINFVGEIRTQDFYLPDISPTLLAGFLGRQEILALFFEKAKSKYGNQELFWWACAFGQVEEPKPDQNQDWNKPVVYRRPPIWITCQQGHFDVVNRLIHNGANVDQARTDDGATPLFIACQKGYLDIARLLIEKGANVNQARTDDGATPLFIACQKGNLDIARLLIEKGANVNQARTNDGATPLFIACQKGYLDIARLLIEKGANVDQACTNDGATPLFIACQNGHLDIARLLIEKGANVNQACTDDGSTPLFIACQQGHINIASLLIEKDAGVNQTRKHDGATPLYIVCQQGHINIASLLIEKGANVNQARTDDGTTPLYIACQQGHINIASLLIEKEANVNQAKYTGAAPLDIALQSGHTQIANLLKAWARLEGKLTEEKLINAFKIYSNVFFPEKARLSRFFSFPLGNHYADILQLAFKQFDLNNNNQNKLEQFLSLVKHIASEQKVNLEDYKDGEFYSLVTLSEMFLGKSLKDIPSLQPGNFVVVNGFCERISPYHGH